MQKERSPEAEAEMQAMPVAENVDEPSEELKKTRFQNFLDRLKISDQNHKLPIRVWMTWAGVILFIALVIAYYATTGGG